MLGLSVVVYIVFDIWLDFFHMISDDLAGSATQVCKFAKPVIRPRGYKTFFMLNSAEHEIYPAHMCYNANNC